MIYPFCIEIGFYEHSKLYIIAEALYYSQVLSDSLIVSIKQIWNLKFNSGKRNKQSLKSLHVLSALGWYLVDLKQMSEAILQLGIPFFTHSSSSFQTVQKKILLHRFFS
jgi:hypothetical protein